MRCDIQQFVGSSFGSSSGTGQSVQAWVKPRGKTMCSILLIGSGGNGGNGAIGAAGAAAGGGGGGSGSQVTLTMPLFMLPDMLYLYLGDLTFLNSTIRVSLDNSASNNVLMVVYPGGNGGNASGATAGIAGVAGVVPTAANMPLGWAFRASTVIGTGTPGIAGGTNIAGGAWEMSTSGNTGLLVTGGTGGGGLPSTAIAGTAGGGITGQGLLPSIVGPAGGSTATTPPSHGTNGLAPVPNLGFWYGGTGGGSTHGGATGAGLVQSNGGNGSYGCGGGGSGGALTGSAAGTPGVGGPSYCLITCW